MKPVRKVRSAKQNRRDAKLGPRRTKTIGLVCILLALVVLFQIMGGVAGISHSMARHALLQRDTAKADWWLSTFRWASSSLSETELLRARSARFQGDIAGMNSHLQSAFRMGHDPKLLHREELLVAVGNGQLDDPIEKDINDWLSEPEADIADILDNYTNGLASLSRFAEARAFLFAWEKDLPTDPLPNYRMARIHEHLLQVDVAEAEYRKAILKSPTHVRALFGLARLLLNQRKPADALELFQRCNTGPTSLAARTGAAMCYDSLGETEKSLTILREVFASGEEKIVASYRSAGEVPERYVVASELGRIENGLGNFVAAKTYLEAALQSSPRDTVARYSYAVALRGLGMTKEADESFAKTTAAREALDKVTGLQERIGKDSTDTAARVQVGQIILQHESERTGIYWIQSVFSYDPANLEAHAALADYFESKPDREEPKNRKLIEYHRSFVNKPK